jgi:adenylate cyclase class 2
MSESGRETEAKFYVQDLAAIKKRLAELGARLVQARVLETNIRFDLPGARLRAERRVLRLRQDTAARLTYKSASKKKQGVLSREEIEFVVEDFEKAREFLEALGYQKFFYYEKYRTTYEYNETLIMLDELPYGSFVEIEGHTISSIHGIAQELELDSTLAITTGYHSLFERVRKTRRLLFPDLSFASFAGMDIHADDLGVRAADRASSFSSFSK